MGPGEATAGDGGGATAAGPSDVADAARKALPKAAVIIAADLRAEIIGKGLPPGTALPSEADLVARYPFSRAGVREALRLLEADGLIYIKRGARGGVRVSRPDMSQISRSFAMLFATERTPLRDLIRFRQLLEPAAAAAAARSATPAQHERLIEVTEMPESYRHSGSDLDIHRVLVDWSDNQLLRTTLLAVQQLSDWHIPAEALSTQHIAGARKAHRRMALAIVRGDATEAGRIMMVHLAAFEEVLESLGRLDEPIIPLSHWSTAVRGVPGLSSLP